MITKQNRYWFIPLLALVGLMNPILLLIVIMLMTDNKNQN